MYEKKGEIIINNMFDNYERLAIHYAAANNHVLLMQEILLMHGNLFINDKFDKTPFHLACDAAKIDAIVMTYGH